MRISKLVPAALCVAFSAGAWAMSQTPEQRCDLLQKQWKEALPQHADAAKIATAKSLHAEGFTLCLAGKTTEGVLKLEEALRDLGVQPEI